MVSLIIPAYNEEKSIGDVVDACLRALESCCKGESYEVIVVDDGSTDSSRSILEKKNVCVVSHAKRRGVGQARTTGLHHAKGDTVLFIDADMSYSADDLPGILEELKTSDMVIGARKREMGTLPWVRWLMKQAFNVLAGVLTKTRIPDLNSGLRGMDREKILEFQYLLPAGHSWVSTSTLCFLASGYTVQFVPISYLKRRGKSTFNIVRDTYTFFLTIMKTIVYFYPLRVMMPLSLGFFAGGIAFLIRDFQQRDIADTTVLLVVMGILVFIFALVAEQLACLRREIAQKLRHR